MATEIVKRTAYVGDWEPNKPYPKHAAFVFGGMLYRTTRRMITPLVFVESSPDYEWINPCPDNTTDIFLDTFQGDGPIEAHDPDTGIPPWIVMIGEGDIVDNQLILHGQILCQQTDAPDDLTVSTVFYPLSVVAPCWLIIRLAFPESFIMAKVDPETGLFSLIAQTDALTVQIDEEVSFGVQVNPATYSVEITAVGTAITAIMSCPAGIFTLSGTCDVSHVANDYVGLYSTDASIDLLEVTTPV